MVVNNKINYSLGVGLILLEQTRMHLPGLEFSELNMEGMEKR